MARQSAGLLVYREGGDGIEVLLAHPGGPYWRKRDAGAWTIPKGEVDGRESPLNAARREFREETGLEPWAEGVPLGSVRQRGGKVVWAWAVREDLDLTGFRSSTFDLEWPPGSGAHEPFQEIDRVEWFTLGDAREKILRYQEVFLDRLVAASGFGREARPG